MSETIVKCPHCDADVPWNETSPFRPFCSERCKMVDLGAWFDESSRAIPGDQPPEDDPGT